MGFEPVKQRRLSDDIVKHLEALIAEGSLRPGERLPAERVLAERFGVSRPSLREAIQKLIARGLLLSRQGGGTYVTEALNSAFTDPLLPLLESREETRRDLLEFRHTLESACAYYAAQRATEPDLARLTLAWERLEDCYRRRETLTREEEGEADAAFHLAIAEASHNAVYLHSIRSLFELLRHHMVTNIGGMQAQRGETRERLLEQHRSLYQAIVAGEAETAREAASRHLGYVREVLEEAGAMAGRLARAKRRDEL
ncbi:MULTISPECIES: FCD domain-containing protein [Pseudomonas]|jgi:GntR family transcriptional repressor for pyruvate dehydrogenase complex|uniref:Pyruvate dehydrogenase complex repressor n=1 Tax=Pseudomonas flavocrustae TaxID=2991719 RepID=A0ABT6IDV4_9PSED|nr:MULTISPECIES: FCD domain-containing protein [Pseudomonas]MDH4762591.1 FCD domain-containing protein [Pseudomonas sp. CBMAI 2609]MDK8266108.1 FCD domain-containing protein [Pseudomonas oryzihabitans]MDR6229972.1 GntR family transcriptional repressor for pyruvate dehydrogenase complex [Pseudomonas sp. SORGH_AS_0199]QNQ99096.1 transcriptional regulator PdhR [Pseudomonas psychrotolerans]